MKTGMLAAEAVFTELEKDTEVRLVPPHNSQPNAAVFRVFRMLGFCKFGPFEF
jgi:hypothetical protein